MQDGSATSYCACDVGGTKTAVALFSAADESSTPLVSRRYESGAYEGIEPILDDFLERTGERPQAVCLGIAGVVENGRAELTNLPWVIEASRLRQFGFETVTLINDMTAVAASLPLLGSGDLVRLQEGTGPRGEVAAVLAPGTGLGEGFVFHVDDIPHPRGGEGGHSAFSPVTEEQMALLAWMTARYASPVSSEMVCSGPAIGDLYDFLRERGESGNEEIARKAREADDRTPVIVEAAVAGDCPLCAGVVDLFLALLGREAANLVLKVYATRGLYLGGGIIPRLINTVSFDPFLRAFRRAGQMSELVSSIPVWAILRDDAALLGAAWYARSTMERERH